MPEPLERSLCTGGLVNSRTRPAGHRSVPPALSALWNRVAEGGNVAQKLVIVVSRASAVLSLLVAGVPGRHEGK